MGLDVALGVIVALGALRGWFRGFTSQAVRLVGLVACVYLASPVREQARPYILARMPAIDAGLMDRIIWWVAAIVSYIVLVGLLTLAIQLMRSPPNPEGRNGRGGDRLGGLLLGAAKSAVAAAFVAAGVHTYGEKLAQQIPWAGRQIEGSHALVWTVQYRPVPRVWSTAPVQNFVQQIQRNGLKPSAETPSDKQLAERVAAEPEASNRTPRLGLPPAELPPPEAWPDDSVLGEDFARDLERIKQELRDRKSAP